MTDRRNEIRRVEQIRSGGVYFLPAGALTDELHLAAFHGPVSRRTVYEDLIRPNGRPGVPCLPLGKVFVLRVDALVDYVAEHEEPQCDASPQCTKPK